MLRRTAITVVFTAALSVVTGSALACPAPPPSQAPADRLVITYQEEDAAEAEQFELRCHPAGGTHPAAQDACAAVDQATRTRARSLWEPVGQDVMCTQIYGGPQTARVTGTWGGRQVDSRFERTNGCEIDRWDAMTPALPEVR
ncbi:SSI family serine proteinase inhibitor [Streptomyces sp. TRM 70351]|uniref:SSI family serine proteinase inhibitor n=1 Tax=Streptomyces sp. TRM 70351 TaxID=3116552 RepID=UPI002E7B892E|nr:SSI family serine proteinase inhibitor [Streptomyces sp. TRM 70351]MEE1930187.1 SSI family serine proteinase inhibitor [Streptomyces sp. TRM 70351]